VENGKVIVTSYVVYPQMTTCNVGQIA